MEKALIDSNHASNLLKLLGLVVGGFMILQTLLPVAQLGVIPMVWVTKAGWYKFPVNRWGRFCAMLVVFLLITGSYYGLKAGIEAERAKAKLNWSKLTPAEVLMNRNVIREKTFSAILMDPLNWRLWRRWSETKQMLEHGRTE